LGFKKIIDNSREPLKCWGCGEPNLFKNFPYINSTKKNIQNIQEASKTEYIGKSVHRINDHVDGRQVDDQSTLVEIEGRVHARKKYILIDNRESLCSITPYLVDSSNLKKVKHNKS